MFFFFFVVVGLIYKRGWWCAWCKLPYRKVGDNDEAVKKAWIACEFCHRFSPLRVREEVRRRGIEPGALRVSVV